MARIVKPSGREKTRWGERGSGFSWRYKQVNNVLVHRYTRRPVGMPTEEHRQLQLARKAGREKNSEKSRTTRIKTTQNKVRMAAVLLKDCPGNF